MKEITKVVLHNFQAHSDLEVNFSEFTAIVGASDKGKSAIVRAIKWCLYNEPPRKKGFIKRGTTTAWVIVHFSDGTIIKRTKNKSGSENSYDITYATGETLHLENFGVGPKYEVVAAHRMFPIDMFGEQQTLNIHDQLSPPFFLGQSPTNKAVLIGNLGHTDTIDLAIKNASSEARAKKAKMKEYKVDLKEVKSELSELKDIGSMEKSFEFAKEKLKDIEYLEVKSKHIKDILEPLQKYSDRLSELKENLVDINVINDSLSDIEEASASLKKVNEINELLESLNELDERRKSICSFLEKVDDKELEQVISDINEAINICSEIEQKKKSLKKLKNILSEIEKLNETLEECKSLPKIEEIDIALDLIDDSLNICNTISNIKSIDKKREEQIMRKVKGENVIKSIDKEYSEMLNEYRKCLLDEKVCPVCFSSLSEDKLENIEKYI